jgi:flavin-dependent dehydrogenase
VPDFVAKGAPFAAPVERDAVFDERGKLKFPITPPPLTNHGNHIISLNKFVKWLRQVESEGGVDILPVRRVGGQTTARASSACARAIAGSTNTAATGPRPAARPPAGATAAAPAAPR